MLIAKCVWRARGSSSRIIGKKIGMCIVVIHLIDCCECVFSATVASSVGDRVSGNSSCSGGGPFANFDGKKKHASTAVRQLEHTLPPTAVNNRIADNHSRYVQIRTYIHVRRAYLNLHAPKPLASKYIDRNTTGRQPQRLLHVFV